MKKKERLDSPEDIKKFLELENELQKIIEYRNDCQLYDADDEKDC